MLLASGGAEYHEQVCAERGRRIDIAKVQDIQMVKANIYREVMEERL